MKVVFCGDVFFGGDLANNPCHDTIDVEVFKRADIRVINLEQAISNNCHVEEKCTLYTDSYVTKQLHALKIDAVNLAHNHIQDKGLDAIEETTTHLNNARIAHFGAGQNINYAQKPFWLSEKIAILGYCDFNQPYLKQVSVATHQDPGVNPLRIKKIKDDLDRLPEDSKAILYFHWGMEHVWLPPSKDIALSKKLLEDDRVLAIIGMHPHRLQGVVRHAGKEAYMCLGNFIFPNFFIKPLVQLHHPTALERSQIKYVTRQYHSVSELTYKKWRWVNRVSMILEFCTESYKFRPYYVVQDDNNPRVTSLRSSGLILYKGWFWLLSQIYRLPAAIYKIIATFHVFQAKRAWSLQIQIFKIRQVGLKSYLRQIYQKYKT